MTDQPGQNPPGTPPTDDDEPFAKPVLDGTWAYDSARFEPVVPVDNDGPDIESGALPAASTLNDAQRAKLSKALEEYREKTEVAEKIAPRKGDGRTGAEHEGAAPEDAAPTPEDLRVVAEDYLRSVQRPVIGADPSDLTDEELSDRLNDAAYDEFWQEVTGNPDPSAADIQAVIDQAQDTATRDLFGRLPQSALDKLIVDELWRDPSGANDTQAGQLGGSFGIDFGATSGGKAGAGVPGGGVGETGGRGRDQTGGGAGGGGGVSAGKGGANDGPSDGPSDGPDDGPNDGPGNEEVPEAEDEGTGDGEGSGEGDGDGEGGGDDGDGDSSSGEPTVDIGDPEHAGGAEYHPSEEAKAESDAQAEEEEKDVDELFDDEGNYIGPGADTDSDDSDDKDDDEAGGGTEHPGWGEGGGGAPVTRAPSLDGFDAATSRAVTNPQRDWTDPGRDDAPSAEPVGVPVDLKERYLGGDTRGAEVGGSSGGRLPDSVDPSGPVINPGPDGDSSQQGMGREQNPFEEATPGLEEEADASTAETDDAGSEGLRPSVEFEAPPDLPVGAHVDRTQYAVRGGGGGRPTGESTGAGPDVPLSDTDRARLQDAFDGFREAAASDGADDSVTADEEPPVTGYPIEDDATLTGDEPSTSTDAAVPVGSSDSTITDSSTDDDGASSDDFGFGQGAIDTHPVPDATEAIMPADDAIGAVDALPDLPDLEPVEEPLDTTPPAAHDIELDDGPDLPVADLS